MVKIYNFLIYLFIIDFTLGGAGRYLAVGPISIRIAIFLTIIIATSVIFLKNKKIIRNNNYLLLFILIISFLLSTTIGIFNGNEISVVIDKLLGYSSILVLPFFIETINTQEKAEKYYNFFEKLVILLSVVTLVVFIILTINNDFFSTISSFFSNYKLGRIAINSGVVRIFITTSIFIPIVLIHKIIKYKKTYKNIVEIFLLSAALYVTMTMAFWIAFFFVFIFYFLFIKKIDIKIIVFGSVVGIFLLLIFNYLGIFDILQQRLSSSDGSTAIKLQQINKATEMLAIHPLFGFGFGTPIEVGGINSYTTINLEIMWLELLINSGFFGFIIYFGFILSNIINSFRVFKRTKQNNVLAIALGLIILVIVNFSNPFLNNPVGISYLVFGISIVRNYKIIKL